MDDVASENTPFASMTTAAPVRRRRYRGGFHTSICDIFRDPHRPTECCPLACFGIISSDRSRYLLTGERPPPLWRRVLMFFIVPASLIAAMNFFATDFTVVDDDGQTQTLKVPSGIPFFLLLSYVIAIVWLGFVKHRRTRKQIMTKLYEERSRELGEEVDARQLQSFIERHNLDTMRAHCCWSFCYAHDDDFIDETGAIHRQCHMEDDDDLPYEDFCTRLWSCLSGMFWCCGCWCQCFGICALAQEEREINRLTNNEEQKIDYLTFQPYSEYYPTIKYLRENQIKSPRRHFGAVSELSSNIIKHVAVVLVVLLVVALSNIESTFTWENLVVLLLTLGQAFFIEYIVHWRWNLFDLSLDSVVKYFASGFFLATPLAIIFESIMTTMAGFVFLLALTLVIASDSGLANELSADPEKGMKDLAVNHPGVFIFIQFVNSFFVAALVEEMMKYFTYRMVVTPDLIPLQGRTLSSLASSNTGEGGRVHGCSVGARSTGSAITVAMVSVALGFACCENLVYIFVYSPPSLDLEISTLLARSCFPVHPLCAAIQSIGVCKRDIEGDKRHGLGRIIFPAILLHGTFDFVLMLAAYFHQVENIKEENDDDGTPPASHDEEQTRDVSQLPALTCGLVLVITGYAYYVIQSRAQTRRLVAMDNAAIDRNSLLV